MGFHDQHPKQPIAPHDDDKLSELPSRKPQHRFVRLHPPPKRPAGQRPIGAWPSASYKQPE
jgi:hypothetical protein